MSYSQLTEKVQNMFLNYEITSLQYDKYQLTDQNVYKCRVELTSLNLASRLRTKNIDNLIIIENEFGNYQVSFENIISHKNVNENININQALFTIVDSYTLIDKIICNIRITNNTEENFDFHTGDYPLIIQNSNVFRNINCNENQTISIEPNSTDEVALQFNQEYNANQFYRIQIGEEQIKI